MVKTYNPSDVVVIYGAKQITGFSEDDMITIKPGGSGTQKYVGVDGEVSRSIDPDTTVEVTMTLATTSDSNDTLMEAYEADRTYGSGMQELIIKDLSGSTIVSAAQAWVANMPTKKFGKKIDKNEWTMHTGQASSFIGGNS